MTFDTELQRQQDATAIATQIKEQVKTVAENKNIDIEYNGDDALSLLNKIDDGTITTPTDTLDITDNGIKDVTNYASVDVNVVTPSQEKTATPTTVQQVVEPDSGYLLSQVTINGVTSSIDPNITPLNIREGVTILGVEGNLAPDKPDQNKTVVPTTSEQVVMADEGYELASVTVTAVTSDIDSNIQPDNIKQGVEILGVQGTLEEGITPTGQLEITENGVRDVTNYASVNVNVGSEGKYNIESVILDDQTQELKITTQVKNKLDFKTAVININHTYEPLGLLFNFTFNITNNEGVYSIIETSNKSVSNVNIDKENEIISFILTYNLYDDYEVNLEFELNFSSNEYSFAEPLHMPDIQRGQMTNNTIIYADFNTLVPISKVTADDINVPIEKEASELPAFMSAKNFTFDGNACTGYVGDNTLPEIIIPQSYSITSTTQASDGLKILEKFMFCEEVSRHGNFMNAEFSDGTGHTRSYPDAMMMREELERDFPEDCYLVSMLVERPEDFEWINRFPSDSGVIQYPITINGQTFNESFDAFDYILRENLTDVNFSGDTEVISYIDGDGYQVTSVSAVDNNSGFEDYQNHIILLSNITSIGEYAFSSCSSLTSITIPSRVTSIGYSAFRHCSSLTIITIPESVTSIGGSAFNSCTNLTTVNFGNDSQLTSIESNTFENCSSLTIITIPSRVTSIGGSAFNNCTNLTSITIPEGVTSIIDYAFQFCGNLQITVEEGNQNYSSDNGSLYNKTQTTLIRGAGGVTTVNILDTVTSIGASAFSGCSSLTSIDIPTSATSIGNEAFRNCTNLTSITIPEGVTSIGSYAFYRCTSLTSITIPEGVTSIESYTFYNCSSLTNITIPEGVTSIGRSVFYGCSSLTTVQVNATTPPTIQSNTFDDTVQRYEVPAESVEAYKQATNWAKYADKIFAKPTV